MGFRDHERSLGTLPAPDKKYNKGFSRNDHFDKLVPHVRIPFAFKRRAIRLLGFYVSLAVVNAWISKKSSGEKAYDAQEFIHHRSIVQFARKLAIQYAEKAGVASTGREHAPPSHPVKPRTKYTVH